MLDAVALSPDGVAWSVTTRGGRRFIVSHGHDGARVHHETGDALRALAVGCAADRGVVHAVGRRHHVSRDGGATWTAGASGVASPMACWLSPSGALFVVGDDGAVSRIERDGDGDTHVDLQLGAAGFLGVHGTADDDVYVVGEGRGIHHFDGHHWVSVFPPVGGYTFQGVYCASRDDVWLVCSSGAVFRGNARDAFVQVAHAGDEVYGVGVGHGGVFIHAGPTVLRLDGEALVVVLEGTALLQRAGVYPTAIAADGVRVVVAGVDTAWENEGAGFVALPSGEPSNLTPRPPLQLRGEGERRPQGSKVAKPTKKTAKKTAKTPAKKAAKTPAKKAAKKTTKR